MMVIDTSNHGLRPRKAKKISPARWTFVILAGSLFVGLLWIVVSGLIALAALSEAGNAAKSIKSHLSEGETTSIHQDSIAFSLAARRAHVFTQDILWSSLGSIPLIGPNFRAISVTSEAMDILGTDGIPSLLELESVVDPSALMPNQGHIDAGPLLDAQPYSKKASEAFDKADELMVSIDTTEVVGKLRDQLVPVTRLIHKSKTVVETVNAAIQLMPDMLGENSDRFYILMFQNTAEARATGGIPGALALVKTSHGQISLISQASSRDFPLYDPPVIDLPQGTKNVFGTLPAQRIQDVNYTPDFEITAKATQAMWEKKFGQSVDGIVSVDPVALSYVLEATDPIALPTGEQLDAENALKLLLSDVYSKYSDPVDQDMFFASVAVSVFDKVTTGKVDSPKLFSAIAKAGEEHRIYLWNKNPREQAEITGTTLATLLPQTAPGQTAYGIYFNDQTGSKMDTYLDVVITPKLSLSRNDTRNVFDFTVSLTNTAPNNAGTELPAYVTGGGAFGASPGSIRTQLVFYGPAGSFWSAHTSEGVNLPIFTTTDGEYSVALVELDLQPGQNSNVKLINVSQVGSSAVMNLITTPLQHLKINKKVP